MMAPSTDDVCSAIARELETRIGASATRMSVPTLAAAVERVRVGTRSTDAMQVLSRLQAGDPEVSEALVLEATVGETYFFRDRGHLDVLCRELLPGLLAAHRDRRIRIWSAGCATGEEPYSIAITCLESLGRRAAERVEILATDVSPVAVRKAREGVYGPWSFRGVSSTTRGAWFDRAGRLASEPRRLVTFRLHNLLDPVGWPEDVDVVFCRNVLIYFTPEHVQSCIDRFAACLADPGWLVLGPSDPPPATPALRPRGLEGTIVYGRFEESAPPTLAPPPPMPVPTSARPVSVPPIVRSTPTPKAPRSLDSRLALARELADRGAHREALVALDAMVEEAPGIETWMARGTIRSASGDHRGATEDAEHALALEPSLPAAHLLLATSRAARGDLVGARRAALDAQRSLADRAPREDVAHAGGRRVDEMMRTASRIGRLRARRRRA